MSRFFPNEVTGAFSRGTSNVSAKEDSDLEISMRTSTRAVDSEESGRMRVVTTVTVTLTVVRTVKKKSVK